MSESEGDDANRSGAPPLLRFDVYLRSEVANPNPSVPGLSEFVRPDKQEGERPAPETIALASLACRIYEIRQSRSNFFSPSLLGEPVWDMLLALYCLSARGEELSVSGLCHASGVPQTTALRWAQTLEAHKLITRTKDASDARRAHVKLSGQGRQLMDELLESIRDSFSAT